MDVKIGLCRKNIKHNGVNLPNLGLILQVYMLLRGENLPKNLPKTCRNFGVCSMRACPGMAAL